MGLFWGSEDAAKVNKEREHERLEETDKRFKPLVLENYAGSGYASKEFGYIIRDIQQAASYNNKFLSKMYDMMQQLLKENEEMRYRLESLEKQVQQNANPSLERVI